MIARLLTVVLVIGLSVLSLGSYQPHSLAQQQDGCFQETGFCISGRIREFWEQNGGLPVFGFPITPQRQETIEGKSLQVQWFERNRLELHPEKERPYDVLLGRLGVDVLEKNGRNWQNDQEFPKETPKAGCEFFEQTGFNVCSPILERWQNPGSQLSGMELFGLPISPLQRETLSDGKEYFVQWFERARFELHPENDPPYDVLFGLLGSEIVPTDDLIVFQKVTTEENSQIFSVASQKGGGFRPVTNEGINATPTVHVSEDGRIWVAFERYVDNKWDIYVQEFPDGEMYPLIDSPDIDGRPAWSRDGKYIAFHSRPNENENSNYDIYVAPVTLGQDGKWKAGDRVPLTADKNWHHSSPSWSSDGKKIAYQSNMNHQDSWEIYVMDVNYVDESISGGDNHKPIAEGMRPDWSWSSDGQSIAFQRNEGEGSNDDVYVMDADGNNPKNITNSPNTVDQEPAWSPDGAQLVFQSWDGTSWDIFIVKADGTIPAVRVSQTSEHEFRPVWVKVPTTETLQPTPTITPTTTVTPTEESTPEPQPMPTEESTPEPQPMPTEESTPEPQPMPTEESTAEPTATPTTENPGDSGQPTETATALAEAATALAETATALAETATALIPDLVSSPTPTPTLTPIPRR